MATRKHAVRKSYASPARLKPESHGARGRRAGLRPQTLANLAVGDHADKDGLLLRVFPSGVRAWMLRYRPRAGTMKESNVGSA